MPTASPRSTLSDFIRQGVRFITLLGSEDGAAPTLEQEARDLNLSASPSLRAVRAGQLGQVPL